MTSPLRQVLDAVEAGATTRGVVADRTGLDPDVVDGAVDHLLRLGRIATPTLRTACPDGGCAGCGTVTGAGCSPPAASGPVAVTVHTTSASGR